MSKKTSLLIDTYKAHNPYSGLGQFSIQFAKHLLESSTEEFEISFLGKPRNFLDNASSMVSPNLMRRLFPGANKHYDIWHSLYQLPSYLPPHSSKWVLTIHDLNFLKEKNSQKAQKYLRKVQSHVNKAAVVTTISNYSKSQIEQHLDVNGKKIEVIHNGVDINLNEESEPEQIPNGPYFCSIGIFNAKKNFKVLVPMMKQFLDHQLIIIGYHDTPYGKEVKTEIARLGLSDKVILTGEISNASKNWYFSRMECFLFPSTAEGFGIPPIEAMLHGKPVVLNNCTSLPEVGGEFAGYFNGFNPVEMSKVVQETIERANEPNFEDAVQKHAQQFSWEKAISKYIEIYRSLI